MMTTEKIVWQSDGTDLIRLIKNNKGEIQAQSGYAEEHGIDWYIRAYIHPVMMGCVEALARVKLAAEVLMKADREYGPKWDRLEVSISETLKDAKQWDRLKEELVDALNACTPNEWPTTKPEVLLETDYQRVLLYANGTLCCDERETNVSKWRTVKCHPRP